MGGLALMSGSRDPAIGEEMSDCRKGYGGTSRSLEEASIENEEREEGQKSAGPWWEHGH